MGKLKALFYMASMALQESDCESAISYLTQMLEVEPNNQQALYYLGLAYQYDNAYVEATAAYSQLLKLNPVHEHALRNLAACYQATEQFLDSVQYYQRALELNPHDPILQRELYYAASIICEWDICDRLRDSIIANASVVNKKDRWFQFWKLFLPFTSVQLYQQAKAYADDMSAQLLAQRAELQQKESVQAGERIRIGYLSANFRSHPIGHLTRSLFEYHDKNKFEVFCFSLTKPEHSVYQQSIYAQVEHVIDLRELSAYAAAERIKQEGTDILIDLDAYTHAVNTNIMFMRPAPVQINYLGYPSTSGADCYDYIIADPYVIPEHQRQDYSEEIITLPHCYMVTDNAAPITRPRPSRADCGLPEDAVVYCCFNHACKITREVFQVWMRILEQVPNSVLWLGLRRQEIADNLRAELLDKCGIEQERLIIPNYSVGEKSEHLARVSHADLFLDTHEFNGHTTAVDALWAGVPVLAYPGETFHSRVSMSLLQNVGLPELIVDSYAAYEGLAVELGRQPQRLQQLREQLAENKKHMPLFATNRVVKELENVYEQTIKRYHSINA